MPDRPKVEFEYGKFRGPNMTGWNATTREGKAAFSCAGVYVATVVKKNGWKQVSDWKWDVTYTNFHASDNPEHDETWGDGPWKDHRKVGGYILADEINGFGMFFTAEANFKKGDRVETFIYGRDIYGIKDTLTGKAIETDTMDLNDDDGDVIDPAPEPDPEPEPEPNPQPEPSLWDKIIEFLINLLNKIFK